MAAQKGERNAAIPWILNDRAIHITQCLSAPWWSQRFHEQVKPQSVALLSSNARYNSLASGRSGCHLVRAVRIAGSGSCGHLPPFTDENIVRGSLALTNVPPSLASRYFTSRGEPRQRSLLEIGGNCWRSKPWLLAVFRSEWRGCPAHNPLKP